MCVGFLFLLVIKWLVSAFSLPFQVWSEMQHHTGAVAFPPCLPSHLSHCLSFLYSLLPPFSLLSAHLLMKGSDRENYFAWIVFVHTHNSITLGVVMRQCAGWLLRNLREEFRTRVCCPHTYICVCYFFIVLPLPPFFSGQWPFCGENSLSCSVRGNMMCQTTVLLPEVSE